MNGILLEGGHVFDGSGDAGAVRSVLIRDGIVEAFLEPGAERPNDVEVIDVSGKWVTPGFVDLHTHYDAELEIAPALSESVRHGVTTILVGSCGLGMAVGDPVDLADMFCRVEGIPRATVMPLLQRIKNWDGPAAYLEHLESLPLGPNVTALLGHSTIRAAAMGLGRSLDDAPPTTAELEHMDRLLAEALDAGYLGLSINTLKWDKMDGDQFRSRPTPSTFASWSEYRRFARTLRARDRILQGVPNVSTKVNVLLFFLESAGVFRKTLKTMLITMMDAKAQRRPDVYVLIGWLSRLFNSVLGADLRFQSLPNPFDLWVDGMEVPVFEEFGAGTEYLHVGDPEERKRLAAEPSYRRRFKKNWRNRILGRAYHRDFDEPRILEAPDPALVGRSFKAIAKERGVDVEDAFLDLVAEHDRALRWYTVVGNERRHALERIVKHPDVLIGFSDAGAHLRNMAYYNYPLRMLKLVRDAELRGTPFMTTGAAVRRLTGEIGDWLGIDAGHLRVGRRADVAVIDPTALDERVDEVVEEPMPGFNDLRRLVRRNDDTVPLVLINGRVASKHGQASADLGTRAGYGSLLRAHGG